METKRSKVSPSAVWFDPFFCRSRGPGSPVLLALGNLCDQMSQVEQGSVDEAHLLVPLGDEDAKLQQSGRCRGRCYDQLMLVSSSF